MPVDKLIVGPMVAVATPFKDDFSIDYKAFETNLKLALNIVSYSMIFLKTCVKAKIYLMKIKK